MKLVKNMAKNANILVLYLLIITIFSIVGYSSVPQMICAEGKLEGDAINLDDLFAKVYNKVYNFDTMIYDKVDFYLKKVRYKKKNEDNK